MESIAFSMAVAGNQQFIYRQSMDVEQHPGVAISRIAAAIGEPASVLSSAASWTAMLAPARSYRVADW